MVLGTNEYFIHINQRVKLYEGEKNPLPLNCVWQYEQFPKTSSTIK